MSDDTDRPDEDETVEEEGWEDSFAVDGGSEELFCLVLREEFVFRCNAGLSLLCAGKRICRGFKMLGNPMSLLLTGIQCPDPLIPSYEGGNSDEACPSLRDNAADVNFTFESELWFVLGIGFDIVRFVRESQRKSSLWFSYTTMGTVICIPSKLYGLAAFDPRVGESD